MKCPGQDMRFWKPEDVFEIPCLKCGRSIEFFKDDVQRVCGCGEKVVNPRLDFGCAQWCEYGEQCLGFIPPELTERKMELLQGRFKDKLSQAMKKHLRHAPALIHHSLKVARYAEEIARHEGGNPLVVLGSAYLHEILTPSDHEKTDLTQQRPSGEAAPSLVSTLLSRMDLKPEVTKEIAAIIKGFHPHEGEKGLNLRIFNDAHTLAAIEEEGSGRDQAAAEKMAESLFTPAGKKLAGTLFFREKDQYQG